MRNAGLWMGLLGLLVSTAAGGAKYRYPAELPVKALKLDVKREYASVEEERHMRDLHAEEPAKQFKDTRPLSAVTLHVCLANGNDFSVVPESAYESSTVTGGGWATRSMPTVYFSWKPNLPNAEVGEVYPCYISFETGEKKWVTREFSLKVGGSGRHLHCKHCFSVGNAPKTTLTAATHARMEALTGGANGTLARGSMAQSVAMRRGSMDMEKSGGSSGIRVQDVMDGKDLQGHDVQLGEDSYIYSLEALPREDAIGQLKAGLSVHVLDEVAPTFVRVKFTTSNGRTYDGAAKMADLVPQYDLNVVISTPRLATSPDSHQNEWRINNVPFSLVAQGTAGETVRLCCVGADGEVRRLAYLGSTSSSSMYNYLRGSMRLEGAAPGDEYLCYVVHNDGTNTWVSQAFGVRCGEGTHAECADCFEMVSQEKVDALLKRTLAAKKAKGGLGSGMSGQQEVAAGGVPEPGSSSAVIRPGKMRLAKDTSIYSLKALPQEQVLRTLRAGAELYVMEDMGGEFVRVRFMTPAGRSGEGAAKKSDIGPTAR